MKEFEKISRRETNEHTALILMLSVISDKISEIILLLKEPYKVVDTLPKEDYLE